MFFFIKNKYVIANWFWEETSHTHRGAIKLSEASLFIQAFGKKSLAAVLGLGTYLADHSAIV